MIAEVKAAAQYTLRAAESACFVMDVEEWRRLQRWFVRVFPWRYARKRRGHKKPRRARRFMRRLLGARGAR